MFHIVQTFKSLFYVYEYLCDNTRKFFFVNVLMEDSPGTCTYVSIINLTITPLPVESITGDEQNLKAEIS